MVVNYSKWDALELSDDSDIEVHPNVDKRSFIRAKQNQIHMEREKRKHEIKTLKYERIVNDQLLARIDALLAAFRHQASQAVGANADEFVMNAMMKTALPANEDEPPQPPADVHYKEKQPKFSAMIASLVDQVKKGAPRSDLDTDNWYETYLKGIEEHKQKVVQLQSDLLAHLTQLEKEEASKITSESIHTGFNTSHIAKENATPPSASSHAKGKVETVEVLNPAAVKKAPMDRADSGDQTSGADADVDEPGTAIKHNKHDVDDDDDDIEPTELAKEFAKIKIEDYPACLRFIGSHREMLAERETDGLLVEGFNAQLEGKETYAKQCVQQGLLIQYCRSLGQDGVGLFFKRIMTPGHNAQKVFTDDVASTYGRIKTRTAEILSQRAKEQEMGGVEQIQLHAVDPGTEIMINIPQPNSQEEIEQKARAAFERFPPGLQRAMETKSLDRINEVLGKMSVSEAEEVVDQMGELGMLSMEQGVIDGTTEEGQRKIEEIERASKADKAAEGGGEPGPVVADLD